MTGANKLKNKVDGLPLAPGVYLFKDEKGGILYIGKAKSLKKRVQSYFKGPLDAKTQALVYKIRDLDYRLASCESQAQLLEAALIKESQPPYNISLKDDKSFPFIKITAEGFPVVSVCRRKGQADGASLYFGPYTDARLLRQALKVIRKIFGFRSCKDMPGTICLYGRINLCPAPCVGKISHSRYKGIIQNIILFLDSKYALLIDKLSGQMERAAERERFEEAAAIRDQINALGAIASIRDTGLGFSQLEDLQGMLGLDKAPERIEAFDISDISGKESCGSMVSFFKGVADKNNYRRFRIKTVDTIDDYGMIKEVIRRRYARLKKENAPLPDLILIDGGKGHLKAAEREMEVLGIDIPMLSIAKDRENIYIKDRPGTVKFHADTPALNLIRHIRDEAHRFALSYHHILRRKKVLGR
ncbi:MAG: excinuclease ABC subunit UvrC [Candidatus Omnitrophota bacterium]